MDKNMYTSFRFWRNTPKPIICKKNDKSIIDFIVKALQTKK